MLKRAAAVLCALAALSLWVRTYRDSPQARWDFPQFYVAGRIPSASLYNQEAFTTYGRALLASEHVSYIPLYIRPAAFTLPLRLMRNVSYGTAFMAWACLQAVFIICSIILLHRVFPEVSGLLLLAFAGFFPACFGIIFGQDVGWMLLLLSAALYCVTRGHDVAAGLLLGIALYKFNLILLLPIYFLLKRRWRLLVSFAFAGLVLAIVSIWMSPARDYIHLLSRIPIPGTGFKTEYMIGLRGFTAACGVEWLYYILVAVVAPLALRAAVQSDGRSGFAIALLGSMLCAGYVNGYDGTLAAIPLVASLARTADGPLKFAPLLVVVILSRPPLWISPLLLAGILAILCASVYRASSTEASKNAATT